MGERSIWMAVLQDITEIIPLRGVLHRLPVMSSRELEHKVVTMARLDELWSRGTVHPAKIDCHPVDSSVSKVEVLHGGNFILILIVDGTLQLYNTQDVTKLLVKVPPPERPRNFYYFVKHTDIRRSYSLCGKTWILVAYYFYRALE